MVNKIGKWLVQAYGLFWVVFALLSLVSWDDFASLEVTTIPDVLEGVFGGYVSYATFVLLGALGVGLYRFCWWGRYLFTVIFVLSLILPPYVFTELDMVSVLFDVLILYLIWVDKGTVQLFKGKC